MARSVDPTARPAAEVPPGGGETLLRIQEAGEIVGLTPRSIRYYEEMGLLSPSARSEGAYRLFDELDLDRLRFIKGLRDDAGFSIAEIRGLLEDEAARRLARQALEATEDPTERRRILLARLASVDEQLASLRAKQARLKEMIDALDERREHVLGRLAEVGETAPAPVPATIRSARR
jgi:DNA-binding transcriptional MerR regulator